MFKQILQNKKIVIVTLAVLLALVLGIVILVASNSKEAGNKDSDSKTEQGEEDADTQDDKKQTNANDKEENKGDNKGNESSKLEVLEPGQIAPEDSSNVSGSWGNASESDTQTGNTNTTDKTEQTENKKPNEDKQDEDVLEDNKNWGKLH